MPRLCQQQPQLQAYQPYRRVSTPEVPAETVTYLSEVITHFKTLVDDEEKGLLVANVLSEVAGKELRICMDVKCSRQMELLLGHAAPAEILGFLKCLISGSEEGGVEGQGVAFHGVVTR